MDSYSKLYFPRDRIKALFLLLLVGLIYLPFLDNPLVFDDVPFFNSTAPNFADAPFSFGLRWFPYFSFGFTWAFFGEAPPVFRVQNMLLHGMNVLLLLLVLRLWITLFVDEIARQKMANWGAWLGALVFACHPLAVYGAGYLVQRSILMATLFMLVMHLAYFRGLLGGDKRFAALAVAAYFLSVFSKEHALLVPAILLPMTWALRKKIRLSNRALLATWVSVAVVALLVVMRSKGILGATYEPDAVSLFGQQEMLQGVSSLHLLSVLTQAGLFFKYCLLMLIPNPAWMSIDMREMFILSYRNWTSWIGLLAFIGYGFFALKCLLRGGRVALLGVALIFPWLLFLTEFSTVRVQEIFVLYRSYLWLPGYMLLLPLLFSVLPSKKIMLASVVAAALLVPLAWNRLWVMADDYRLWDDAVILLHGEDRLGAQRTYFGRAHASAALNNWDAAIVDYKKSISIDPSRSQVHLALASVYFNAKRYPEALSVLDKLIDREPDNAKAYYNKGILMGLLNDKVEGLKYLKKSCELGGMIACATVHVSQMKKN